MSEPAGLPKINTAIDFKISQSDLIDLMVAEQEDKLLVLQEISANKLADIETEQKLLNDKLEVAANKLGVKPNELSAIQKTFPNLKVGKHTHIHIEKYRENEKKSLEELTKEGKIIIYNFLVSNMYESREFHQIPKSQLIITSKDNLINIDKVYVEITYETIQKQSKRRIKSTNFNYSNRQKCAISKPMIKIIEKINSLKAPWCVVTDELVELEYQLKMLSSDSKKYKTQMVKQILGTTKDGKAILAMTANASIDAFKALPEGKNEE